MSEVAKQGARIQPIESTDDLDRFEQSSCEAPVLLFLDDPWCPVSACASDEVAVVAATVGRIDVSAHSPLGREVERRTGIKHESPQVILLRDGRPGWSASHGRITAAALRAALAEQDG